MNKFFKNASGILDKFSCAIVKGKWICLIAFIVLTIGCACMIPFIEIEYDLTGQMPDKSYTDDALDILKKEFDDKGMTYVCVVNITKNEANALLGELKSIKGVANANLR